jgi:hypothetical protein
MKASGKKTVRLHPGKVKLEQSDTLSHVWLRQTKNRTKRRASDSNFICNLYATHCKYFSDD